jgi:putative colanic acid biosynthesis acetyltransferase WcaF
MTSPTPLDIAANRSARKWSSRELAGRALWALAQPAFVWSPRLLWGWRNALLRLFGARIGADVHIHPSVRIAVPWRLEVGDFTALGDRVVVYSLGQVRIGKAVTVSQHAHLCAGTHDHRLTTFPLVKAPISVGDGAWICADAFVGPGVTVGEHAIVAARAVAVRDVEPWAIVAGNPARRVGARPEPVQP